MYLLEKLSLYMIFFYNFHCEHSVQKLKIKRLSPKINVKNIKKIELRFMKLDMQVEIIRTRNFKLFVYWKPLYRYFQGVLWSGKSQGKLFFLQGQGKVRELCKMVSEIKKNSKVREMSGNFKIMLCSILSN